MAKQTVVTGPLVVARWPNETDWYGYEGTPLPGGLKDGEVERLTELGLVGEAEVPVDDEGEKPPAKKSTK